jgi:hypothetical protein
MCTDRPNDPKCGTRVREYLQLLGEVDVLLLHLLVARRPEDDAAAQPAASGRRCCGRCGHCEYFGYSGYVTVLPRPTVRPTGNDRLSPRVHAVLTRSASTVRTVLAVLRYSRYSGTHSTRGTRSTRVPLQRLAELGPFHKPRDLENRRPFAEAATAAQGTLSTLRIPSKYPTYPKYREPPKHGRPTRGSCGSSLEECGVLTLLLPYCPVPCRARP